MNNNIVKPQKYCEKVGYKDETQSDRLSLKQAKLDSDFNIYPSSNRLNAGSKSVFHKKASLIRQIAYDEEKKCSVCKELLPESENDG